ncbi:hypothetical protein EVAR_12004_1 [Eumeta japonica]|uniref:Uncharacterized protein n=1 Tax=Eumeta variegata TaxID=151549 RepID=A0A4C1U4U2_EUMVA|nr:hypothetical protein EVAR_12004_1 [Eumeta japonica]
MRGSHARASHLTSIRFVFLNENHEATAGGALSWSGHYGFEPPPPSPSPSQLARPEMLYVRFESSLLTHCNITRPDCFNSSRIPHES